MRDDRARRLRQIDEGRKEMAERIHALVPAEGQTTLLPGLYLSRISEPTGLIHGSSKAALCIAVQGAKDVHLGDRVYRYDAENYLLTTVELPITFMVCDASATRPYLSLRLELDPALVASVMVEHRMPPPQSPVDTKAMTASPLDFGLFDAALRLVRLLDAAPEERALMPLVMREIVYRLLVGEQGHRLRHLSELGGRGHRIVRAVDRLRKEFDRPLRSDALAKELGMSLSGFHQHFKAVTDLSPLQYQKRLRLHEARRLMLGEGLDAASAGYRVGYDDPSHFSRDYKRHFGDAPMRDVERLRTTVLVESI
jgi:AraC-like DNA-binding protein